MGREQTSPLKPEHFTPVGRAVLCAPRPRKPPRSCCLAARRRLRALPCSLAPFQSERELCRLESLRFKSSLNPPKSCLPRDNAPICHLLSAIGDWLFAPRSDAAPPP